MKRKRVTLQWWKCDLVNFVASHLDAESLVNFSSCCRDVNVNLKSKNTLRWLADLRGIPHSLDNFEQLELAEAMANFKSMIFFNWSDTNLANPDHVSLGVVARALHRHSSLSLSIEAHCSLEGMLHLPTRGTKYLVCKVLSTQYLTHNRHIQSTPRRSL